MPDPRAEIRAAVAGADRVFQVHEGGRGRGGGTTPPPSSEDRDRPCPIVALGHADGMFHVLDVGGQKRAVSARQLGSRHDLLSLFHGDDSWPRAAFPLRKAVKIRGEDGQETTEERVVDFRLNALAAFLQRLCGEAGLFGSHVTLRAPGIWRGEHGMPIVHCGDEILVDGAWQRAGVRIGDQVWSAAPRERRPALSCAAAEVRALQDDLRALWLWRKPGGWIVVLGVIAVAYYGAAAVWRPNLFLTGGAGSGKSVLLKVLAELCPLRYETNDTRKAALEQQLASRAMPAFIDEASDRQDQSAAKSLMDIVLSASGGEGTKGSRGTVDGRGREFAIAGSFVLASIAPPDLGPQHLARITVVDLDKPEAGADATDRHRALQQRARALGPKMWGRALGAFERFERSVALFREQLRVAGCLPREMDQFGAILAGWWVLSAEGEPDPKGARIAVASIAPYLRTAVEVTAEDAPRLVIQHLVSHRITLNRSTEREQIGTLLELGLSNSRAEAWRGEIDTQREPHAARELLAGYGIRVVRADEPRDKRGREAVRGGQGAGVWIAANIASIGEMFRGTRYEGSRWLYEIKRLPGAVERSPVRIGSYAGRAVWLPMDDVYPPEDGSETEPIGSGP